MELIIDLPPDVEKRLCEEALRQRMSPADYAIQLIDRELPKKKSMSNGEAVAIG